MKILLTKRQKACAKLLGAVALLSLYIVGGTQTGYLHQLFHPEEVVVTHSSRQEQDPCHRSLYHGMDTGCRHEFHLVKVHSCGLCHTLTHSDLLLFDSLQGISVTENREAIALPKSRRAINVTRTLLTRGPPVELTV